MRRFFLFKRKESPYYYAHIINPLTSKKMTARSTGCTDRDEAHFTVMTWLKNGEITDGPNKELRKLDEVYAVDDLLFRLKTTPLTGADTDKIIHVLKHRSLITNARVTESNQETLINFLLKFWDWEHSPYVAEKQAYNHSMGKAHVDASRKCIVNYWQKYFDEDILLIDLSREQLREFTIHLSKQKKHSRDKEKRELNVPLSSRTLNAIIKAGTIALNWAQKNGKIDKNPASGIMKFGITSQKRGILTDSELEKIFTSGDWADNEGARLASFLASQTGLRIGEVIALRVCDIEFDRLNINHSFSKVAGLKAPKNGEVRQVPILPLTRGLLLDYAKTNPSGCRPDSFIFYQIEKDDCPLRAETISNRFRKAVDGIIGAEERKARNIVFHGLRHYYVKKMSLALDKRAMMLSGHKSEAVFEHYADHVAKEDFDKAAVATGVVFGHVQYSMEVA